MCRRQRHIRLTRLPLTATDTLTLTDRRWLLELHTATGATHIIMADTAAITAMRITGIPTTAVPITVMDIMATDITLMVVMGITTKEES